MDRILKASYGDKQQREQNLKPVDRLAAARLKEDFKARKAGQGPKEVGHGSTTQCIMQLPDGTHALMTTHYQLQGPYYGSLMDPDGITLVMEIHPHVSM